jgi:hypothetical protein
VGGGGVLDEADGPNGVLALVDCAAEAGDLRSTELGAAVLGVEYSHYFGMSVSILILLSYKTMRSL